jgi:glucose dehydrogenase
MNARYLFLSTSLSIFLCGLMAGTNAVAQDEWPYYGGTQWGERHATLSRIGKHNKAGRE